MKYFRNNTIEIKRMCVLVAPVLVEKVKFEKLGLVEEGGGGGE